MQRPGLSLEFVTPDRRFRSLPTSEQAVRGVPAVDTLQNLVILGDSAMTETPIDMALVGRGEDGVEAFVEEERDREIPQAVVPLIGRPDASSFRDARGRDSIELDPVQYSAGCV